MLEYLMENRGRALTREQLLANSCSCGAEIDNRTVDVHIARLRRAIKDRWQPNPIRTEHGVGYSFDSELRSDAERPALQRIRHMTDLTLYGNNNNGDFSRSRRLEN
jgi:DNA-binding winged helix-turn-helix (wHTH) protein